MSSWVVASVDAAGTWDVVPLPMTADEAHRQADRLVPRGVRVLALDLNSLVERLPHLDSSYDVEHDS